MKQINRIVGKDWLLYHPYTVTTQVDNYYISLCNSVLKIIQQSEIAEFTDDLKGKKSLACMLVAYFEDVISETRLFSTFTRVHKKMYGKKLPFYDTTKDYYKDEINVYDIFFLVWYHASIYNKEIFIDPYFENSSSFNQTILKIYNLFDREFENAPQNNKLQDFLKLPVNSDVKTVREKLTFIAYNSFLWNDFFDHYILEVIEKYKKEDVVVLDEKAEAFVYDKQIRFIFNKCMPLLSMRTNEYYAEILGEEHSEYKYIKNISQQIIGSFLILKIEKEGYLLEHLTSKKQLWLSNEYTTLQNDELKENETVLTISIVQWRDEVWQNQGVCLIATIKEMKGKDVSEHLFEDENRKMKIMEHLENAFLELTNNERIVYMRGKKEYAKFMINLARTHTKMVTPNITDRELDDAYKNDFKVDMSQMPFEKDEAMGIFFSSKRGIEVYREGVISCMPDKNNPFYAHQEFDLCDLIMNRSISVEFINYIIKNNLIRLCVDGYENPDLYGIIMENLDFLLRFYQQSNYFSKPQVTIT